MFEWQTILRAFQHEKWLMMGTASFIIVVGLFAIVKMPDVYVGGSKILVEREDLFVSTGDDEPASRMDSVGRRMHAIISTVMSTESIKGILEENDAIDASMSREELEETIQEFRKSAELQFDNVAVINQFTGKSGMYSQGLTISYENNDPQVAYAMASALTDRVIEAHQGKGERVRTYRLRFLSDKYQRALDEWTEAREAVAEFKNQNALYLPEVHPLAIRRAGDIETQALATEDEISRLRRNLSDVRSDLATVSPESMVVAPDGTRILSVSEQLRQVEAEYAKARARYSDQHPEVQRLRTELDGLRSYSGAPDSSGIQAELQQTRKALAAATQRYSASHPDVQTLTRKVADLESQLKASGSVRTVQPQVSAASNPAYNRLKVREQAIIDDLARQQRKLTDIDLKKTEIQEQLARMPDVEQRLDSLVQKSEAAEREYEGVESELRQTREMAERTDAEILDRFVMVEEPVLPVKPARPHRKLLAIVLALLAGSSGLLVAIMTHLVRGRIYSTEDVEAMYDLPVYLLPKLS